MVNASINFKYHKTATILTKLKKKAYTAHSCRLIMLTEFQYSCSFI